MFGLGKLFRSLIADNESALRKEAEKREAQKPKDCYKQPPTFDIPVSLSHEHGLKFDEMQTIINKLYAQTMIYGASPVFHGTPPVTSKEVYTESQKEIGKAFKIKKYLEPKVTIGFDWGQESHSPHIQSYLDLQHEHWSKYYSIYHDTSDKDEK
jgi:hypothetical protein